MASRSVGVGRKKRKEKQVTHQSKDRVYSRSDGHNYSTGDNTLKKTRGIDEGTLMGTKRENRGRKSKDAAIGKRKEHTKRKKK